MSQQTKKYKQEARQAAVQHLQNKKAAQKEGKQRAFVEENRQKKALFQSNLATLEKTECKAQKKGYSYFKKRKNRTRRTIAWTAVAACALAVVLTISPVLSALTKVLGSQNYTSTGPQAEAVRQAGEALAVEISQEGFVLLKNDNQVLPLRDTKLNIFGDDAYNFVYGGSGSAGADQSGAPTIFRAFTEANIEYNKALDETYHNLGVATGGGSGSIKEMVMNFFLGKEETNDWLLLEQEVIDEAHLYSDTAVIVLSSMEVEGAELDLGLLQIMGNRMPNRAAMIDAVCNTFEHVIFIINSGNVMELGFLDEYESADAALWVGAPGSQGCQVIAQVLKGEVNPSGKTIDTYPVSIESEPSFPTYGDYKYNNLDSNVMEYREGLYIGYRYYETRFGQEASAYGKNVVFPFGYGLSYTTFAQEMVDFVTDGETITATIKVTNIGSVAGKDIVQLYFMAPFYAASGIEKSAIELAGYAKTELLEAGESQTVKISYDVRDMASYAAKRDNGCYLLEKGEYKIAIGNNVHDALLAKDYETYTVENDVKYTTDDTTGTAIQNLFGFAQGDVQYLSRTDWEGTFPTRKETYTASEQLLTEKATYEQALTDFTTEPVYQAENGLVLKDLKGLAYDDAQWNRFLDQFTVEEMMLLTANGGWHTEPIERLGVKASNLLDGPSGINSMFASLEAVAYPMETVIGSSWNNELAQKLGSAVGDEAAVYGVNGWYAPGANIHRTSIGGQNSEYFSEDPLLSGNMAAAAVEGAQDQGIVAFMKHFVCNDVELNARSGIILWADEQALREIYLKPFEIAVKDGGCYGAMSSFSFLGSKWCGGSSELLNDLLREEWGFRGMVTTDACLGGWMSSELAVKNGNDLMLEMGIQTSEKKLKEAYRRDPVGTGNGLRSSVHNICYAMVNGMSLYEV